MTHPTFFNAHHSPIGAFATLTLGSKGAKGGLGIELGGPADESLFVGIEDRDVPGRYLALPLFGSAEDLEASPEDFDVEGLSDFHRATSIFAFPDDEVSRRLGAGIDTWHAGDMTFRVISPVVPVPDPEIASEEALKDAVTPAVLVELTLDNRAGSRERKAFFGYAGSDRYSGMRVWNVGNVVGIGQGLSTAIGSYDDDVYGGVAFQAEQILDPSHRSNLRFLLGSVALLVGTVPAGEVRTFRFAVAFFREGTATTGIATRYLYRRWFDRAEDVVLHALARAEETISVTTDFDRRLSWSVSSERELMVAQAIRSYFGATQLLELPDGRPFWVVNEGEYRMMNTFDLTVDQAFFELAFNPWTVRNELDFFVERYSYDDSVRFPGDPTTYPGGIAFAHDMGIANTFAERGRSGYEQAALRGCFSYMSCEELINWVLTAALYESHTGDHEWVRRHRTTFLACLRSLVNRDHPDPAMRNGVMGLDASRCEGGAEITTYDSLDASLGQARNNVYLAVKAWAAYILLEPIFRELGHPCEAEEAAAQAIRCAATIVAAANEDGLLPAVLGEGVDARIIPAIEGLVYPFVAGREDVLAYDGPFGDLRRTLERHFEAILRPGVCLFDDGGWRLSSTSRNSWLSKIYLCQYVAERIFGRAAGMYADRAHLAWLMDDDNSYYAWSDQMVEGRAVGSRYYPRGVTSILWASGSGRYPICEIREALFEGAPVSEPVAVECHP